MLKILADTRCADQVIRLTNEALENTPGRSIGQNDVFRHEWVHYLQFSGTPTGVMLSYFRRNCFNLLKQTLIDSPKGKYDTKPFCDKLAMFKTLWEAWPPNWYSAGVANPLPVSAVRLELDGLHVELSGSNFEFRLPIGLQAVYEALAWCAAILESDDFDMQVVPKTADYLLYTWPLWVLASRQSSSIDSIKREDIAGVLPLLFIACFYDHRVLPAPNPGLAESFMSIRRDLEKRNVTTGRFIWQIFRDYERFWKQRPSLGNVNSYLGQIGLPSIGLMLEETVETVRRSLTHTEEFFSQMSASMKGGTILIADDMVAEIDLLRTSIVNLEIVNEQFDRALLSPLLLLPDLVPAVCSIERPDGYDWFSVTFQDGPQHHDASQVDNRIILREQLSITEHVMMQAAFGTHLGCYGSIDWRLPINNCPATRDCMNIPDKIGIKFCVDPAWRQRVGMILDGLCGHHNTPPPESVFPGITAAVKEYRKVLRGDDPDIARAKIDFDQLGLNRYLSALYQPDRDS